MSGWYSLVGVFALERMITIEKSENPITIIVKHSRTVFASTFCCFSVRNMPQKHAPRSRSMNTAAPELNGMPSALTKNLSKPAAIFGRYGMIPKRITARITTDTRNILMYSLNV